MVVSAWYGRIAGAISAAVPSLVMWGFTVDDALIPLRYAHHLGLGAGYRFNLQGASTDGVTPLPWAFLLTPLASPADLVVALIRVKVIGIVAWTLAGAALGELLFAMDRKLAVIALAIVALAFPIGAWASSGLETGVATAIVTFAAVSFDRPRRAAILAGIAATLRPELVVWSCFFAAGAAIAPLTTSTTTTTTTTQKARAAILHASIAAAPFMVCAIARLIAFGRAAPLSVLAKPSDLRHGLAYAGAAAIVVLTPILACAPIVLMRRDASLRSKTIALAAAAHVLVVVAVGGDWMPYARLMVPIAPSLAIVFVDTSRFAHRIANGVRAFIALSLGVAVAWVAAPAGRRVQDDRQSLISHARPALVRSRVVAALDVGWVGAAAPDAEIVDLAGVTDPTIATLRGGHTSKNVDVAMLLDRHVDTIVIYWSPRFVEDRLMRSPLFGEYYDLSGNVTMTGPGLYYSVYTRRPPPPKPSEPSEPSE